MKQVGLLLIFLNTIFHAQDFTPLGKNDEVVKHTYYTLSYSEQDEQAEWVYYELNSNQLNSDISRSNNFRKDPYISTSSAQLYDYKGSGYDRGHLAPAGDMKYSSTAMSESFYMSNMSPQTASFNRGKWKKIEKQFRDWSYKYGELIIITGPILNDANLGTIGSNKVTVPRRYYKVAIDPNNLDRNVAILIENRSSSEAIKSFAVSIDELERVSGLDFFHKLSEGTQQRIESRAQTEMWDWNVTYVSKPRTNSETNGQIDYYKDQLPSNSNIFKTKTGKKYHKEGCRYLSKSKIPITIGEAKDKGLGPCGVCKP